MYRIILADDHAMFRAGLRSLIDGQEKLTVVAEAADGEELLALVRRVKCDLVVMDLSMPRMDGMQALAEMRQTFPSVKVLVLTMQKETEHFQQAMACGACGYVLKEDAFEQLIEAIDMIAEGEQFFSPSIVRLMGEQLGRGQDHRQTPGIEVLTHREQQILKLIASGLANKNIACQLNISVRTVEAHRLNVVKKLGIHSTAGLVRYAIEKAFI